MNHDFEAEGRRVCARLEKSERLGKIRMTGGTSKEEQRGRVTGRRTPFIHSETTRSTTLPQHSRQDDQSGAPVSALDTCWWHTVHNPQSQRSERASRSVGGTGDLEEEGHFHQPRSSPVFLDTTNALQDDQKTEKISHTNGKDFGTSTQLNQNIQSSQRLNGTAYVEMQRINRRAERLT